MPGATTTAQRLDRRSMTGRWTRLVPLALALVVAAAGAAEEAMRETSPAAPGGDARPPLGASREPLPEAVGAWARAGEARRVDAATIFDYMDGAGELYLAYRFGHLEAVTYRTGDGDGDEILVEMYRMRGADDAFGLLSGDWGGEPVALAPEPPDGWPRALYGAGLLRLVAGDTYARVMATRETDAARAAVLALGRSIAVAGPPAPAPRLVAALPPSVGPGFALRRESVCFLRSHLVLNSAYFLSRQNILDLGPEVDAVTARYDLSGAGPARRVRVVLAVYPDGGRASRAFDTFRRAYLPEAEPAPGAGSLVLAAIEDGWAGVRRSGRAVAIALECPDRATAAAFVDAGLAALKSTEDTHD